MRRLLVLAALIVMLTPMARTQAMNLSGEWKLNESKSFLGGDHPRADYQLKMTLKVQASSVSESIEAKNAGVAAFGLPKSKSSLDLSIDGKEHEIIVPGFMPGMPPSRLNASAEWQGTTLVITQRGMGFGGLTTTTSRLFLSPDRAQLIELVETHNGFADMQQRRVYERQQ
jgi:hypothetical protein